MQINERKVNEKIEFLNMIKEGINPLEYVKEEKDIDFISNSIIIEGNDEDSYYEETAEIVLKSILYYVLFVENEKRTLQRCKEIAKMGMEDMEKVKELVSKEERANTLFKPVEIASEKTAKEVFEKLNERLSKI